MGVVNLNNLPLIYFCFFVAWLMKLLIHLFHLVILNTYILDRHYGSEKVLKVEFGDNLAKYLLTEGLKNQKIPLPPVLSRKIARSHVNDRNSKRFNKRHFLTNIQVRKEERERN